MIRRDRSLVVALALLLAACGSSSEEEAAGGAATATPLTSETFLDPPAGVRPGTRWWWSDLPGSYEFDLATGLEEIEQMADAGFGRFEIAWGPDWGAPSQQRNLAAVAARAKELGLQLDMTLGASWPWATPETTGDLSQQELMYGRIDVTGPTTWDGTVAPAIGDAQPAGSLIAVTAARVVTSGPAVTQAGTPPASSTILDAESLVDLSALVSPDGRVRWDVPEGDWILFSFWQRNVPGNRVSLISAESVRAGLAYTAEHQLGGAEHEVRAAGHSFFEDSLEYDANELYWSDSFPAEFAARRGYDMTKYLPLMFAQGVSDYWVPEDEPVPDFELPDGGGARYRHDYYETLTDLYLDNHVALVAEWARQYGMKYRAQAGFGNDFDAIRSARGTVAAGGLADDESLNAGDTPFFGGVEGYSDPSRPTWRFALDHYRQISSGVHQAGGVEIASELGAWFGSELRTFLRDYKRMMDKEWAAGITRPLLHGMTHSPPGVPWPGAAHFLGLVGESIDFDTWPELAMMRPLADYWARGALVLQQGVARTDLAILRNSFVTTAAGPPPPRFFFDALRLEEQGFRIGYVDSAGLRGAPTGASGELFPGGPAYRALVIDGAQTWVDETRIDGEAARSIEAAARKGLRVVLVGEPPSHGIGGRDPAEEDRVVRDAMASLRALPTTRQVATQAEVGAALMELGVAPSVRFHEPVRVYTQRRDDEDARYYFLWNATAERLRFEASFAAVAGSEPVRLDLWTGAFEPEPSYDVAGGFVRLPIDLRPHETRVVAFLRGRNRRHVRATSADAVVAVGDDEVEVRDLQGGEQRLDLSDGGSRRVELPVIEESPVVLGTDTPWQLQVTTVASDGPVEKPPLPLAGGLTSWQSIAGLQMDSGFGTYTAAVALPAGWTGAGRGVLLDLGAFHGAVQVYVNDERVTPDIDPQGPLEITRLLRSRENVLRVVLATTPFNAAKFAPGTGITRPLYAAALAEAPLQDYGLLGPVRLIPYASARVRLTR